MSQAVVPLHLDRSEPLKEEVHNAERRLFELCCRGSVSRSDNNLKFQDEADAYKSYKAVGHFTPSPGIIML